MTDKNISIAELKDIVRSFCEARDWDQYHGGKDLAIGVITESSELLEHFRFKSNEEVEKYFKDVKKKSEISEEMADILYFLLRMAQKYDIDLSNELLRKVKKNEVRYPICNSKGSNKKYNEI
jgi:NTP pyrophosphatase (non-canonical NTP hydrolase)